MFRTVKCLSSIKKGDVLTFNTISKVWELATNLSASIGVASEDAFMDQDDNSRYLVAMSVDGPVSAKASRDIPNQGGRLNVENGAVYVDNDANHTEIICPNFIDAVQRKAGELITIVIR